MTLPFGLLILLVIQKPSQPWHAPDWVSAGVMTSGMSADCVTTIAALKRGAVERNPFLGQRPGVLGVTSGCILAWAGTMLVSDALPPKWRRRVLLGIGIIGFGFALHNAKT